MLDSDSVTTQMKIQRKNFNSLETINKPRKHLVMKKKSDKKPGTPLNFGRDGNTIMIKEDVIALEHPQIMTGNHYHQMTEQMQTITVSDHLERNSDKGELTIECFGSDSIEHELISSNRHTCESRSVSKSFERV